MTNMEVEYACKNAGLVGVPDWMLECTVIGVMGIRDVDSIV
jgi:hypothetical protein